MCCAVLINTLFVNAPASQGYLSGCRVVQQIIDVLRPTPRAREVAQSNSCIYTTRAHQQASCDSMRHTCASRETWPVHALTGHCGLGYDPLLDPRLCPSGIELYSSRSLLCSEESGVL